MRSSVKAQHARALFLAGRRDDARRLAEQVVATGYRGREVELLCRDLGVPVPLVRS